MNMKLEPAHDLGESPTAARPELMRSKERRRLARDLHDWLGESLGAAFRQLELHEITSGCTAEPVKESLIEAMRRLRITLFDLRQDPVAGLESAIVGYVDSVGSGPDVRLTVHGDEAWVPNDVMGEAFVIIREALRNVLRHGHSATVTITVAIDPRDLYARVEDDGCGFRPDHLDGPPGGNGLASMRERAILLGGWLTVSSAPGRGTLVQMRLPLPGGAR